jgi:hypothetical protein
MLILNDGVRSSTVYALAAYWVFDHTSILLVKCLLFLDRRPGSKGRLLPQMNSAPG